MNERRAYRSPLREQQAAQTRERIVDGLIEQLDDTGRRDFSMNEVAERAGVSVRTIYRYFPTREDLLDAVQERIDESVQHRPLGTPADFPAHVDQLLSWFEEHSNLVEASHVSELGREVRSHARRRRAVYSRELTTRWLGELSEEEQTMAFAFFRSFITSATWRTMRGELNLDAAQTRDAIQWVLGLVTEDLNRRLERAREGRSES